MVDSFVRFGLCSHIQGPEGGGFSQDLPFAFTLEGQLGSTDAGFDDVQEHTLSTLGFACLTRLKNRPGACFFAMPALHRGALMRDILTISRFADYLRMMALTSGARGEDLNAWLRRYTLPTLCPLLGLSC